jgi:eukaryotic-like serine/threonine-protein kinase
MGIGTLLLQHTLRVHTGQGNDLSWSPDGTCVAAAIDDGYIAVITAATGVWVCTYNSPYETASAVAWSPDGRYIATGSDVSASVTVWNASSASSQQCAFTLERRSGKGEGFDGVAALSWSPNGAYLAAAMWDHTVQVWEFATGELRSIYRDHMSYIWSVRWSPNGRRIASAGNDGSVRVWDAARGQSLYCYRDPSSTAWGVGWSPDSTRVASTWDGGLVRIHDLRNRKILLTYTGHCRATRTRAISWSSAGYLASGDDNGDLQLWHPTTGTWSHQGERLASTGQDGMLHILERVEEKETR